MVHSSIDVLYGGNVDSRTFITSLKNFLAEHAEAKGTSLNCQRRHYLSYDLTFGQVADAFGEDAEELDEVSPQLILELLSDVVSQLTEKDVVVLSCHPRLESVGRFSHLLEHPFFVGLAVQSGIEFWGFDSPKYHMPVDNELPSADEVAALNVRLLDIGLPVPENTKLALAGKLHE